MKPPRFAYHEPTTLPEALDILAQQPGSMALAGGQSLMPMLNFRVVAPEHLVDLNRIEGLAYIHEQHDAVAIGAMTRQRELEFSPVIAKRLPLLAEAIHEVGHRQTRNRGTIGGSLCHLDPAAELPCIAMAHNAELTISRADGSRTIAMRDFAKGLMTTDLGPGELLVEVRLKPWPAGHGWSFLEYARRRGDFAVVSVAVLVKLDASERIERLTATFGGIAHAPVQIDAAEMGLIGAAPDVASGRLASAAGALPALEDPIYPSWYRQQIAGAFAARAFAKAVERVTK